MINYKIKILKDTPFNLAGDILSVKDFRLIYNYICTSSVKDEELIDYIKTYKSYPQLKQTTKYCISEWFEVVQIEEFEEDPLSFIFNGILWYKEFDGVYHGYIVGNELKPENSIDKVLQIADARRIIKESKFKKHIIYCTNNVNKKL